MDETTGRRCLDSALPMSNTGFCETGRPHMLSVVSSFFEGSQWTPRWQVTKALPCHWEPAFQFPEVRSSKQTLWLAGF